MLRENYSLLSHNTFRMDVNCSYFFEYQTVDELCDFLASKLFVNNKSLNVGCGSNLLFRSDYDGIIMHSQIKGVQVEEMTANEAFLRAGAGEIWDDVVCFAVEHDLYGMENLSAIPGTVGASVVQNIGAYGVEVKDVVDAVETVEIATGRKVVFDADDCRFAYRNSVFKTAFANRYIVTSVRYRLRRTPYFNLAYGNISKVMEGRELNLRNLRDAIVEIRRAKLPDPAEYGNAGSFFMNPGVSESCLAEIQKEFPQVPFYALPDGNAKIPAAWLIEQCGWKDNPTEHVAVWQTQPLVMINRGGAKPSEIVDFSQRIISSVCEKFGIRISPEVIFV